MENVRETKTRVLEKTVEQHVDSLFPNSSVTHSPGSIPTSIIHVALRVEANFFGLDQVLQHSVDAIAFVANIASIAAHDDHVPRRGINIK